MGFERSQKTKNMTLKDLVLAKRVRRGPPHKITSDGKYWFGLEVCAAANPVEVPSVWFVVRHYEDNSLRAYCETRSFAGVNITRNRCDEALTAASIEELMVVINSMSDIKSHFQRQLRSALLKALPALPTKLAAPDEEADHEPKQTDEPASSSEVGQA